MNIKPHSCNCCTLNLYGNLTVPALQLDDLFVNKLLSGRAKDKADVEELQKIMRLKKK